MTTQNKVEFDKIYFKLSESGWCDSCYGMEYQRVYEEWKLLNYPKPIDVFIKWRANVTSESDFPVTQEKFNNIIAFSERNLCNDLEVNLKIQ